MIPDTTKPPQVTAHNRPVWALMESTAQMPLAGFSPDMLADRPLQGVLEEEVVVAGVQVESLPITVDPVSWPPRGPAELQEGSHYCPNSALDPKPGPPPLAA